MRNRAKCKLCNDLLESINVHDCVECRCGEIGIDGGKDYFKCHAMNWENFIRIDDEGNEIIPKIIEEKTIEPLPSPKETDPLSEIQNMIERFESLPEHAMLLPITHYDYLSLLYLLKALKSSEKLP